MRGQDRLSSLPDELLHSILSLLPLKSAIATSALSKRWKNLWHPNLISATALDFTNEFSTNQSPKDFVATVHRYLQLHGDQKLDSFRILFCPFDQFLTDIEAWISIAAAKEVKQLELDLSQGIVNSVDGHYLDDRTAFELPDCLLDCKSLTHLRLSRCNFYDLFEFSSFSNILSVSINHGNITDDMLKRLLESCVLLEDLSLAYCQALDYAKVSGSNLSLRKLSIVMCAGLYLLEIYAPKLQSFYYHGDICFHLNFKNISELVEAHICLTGNGSIFDRDYMGYLSRISNVKILTLCSFYLMNLIAIPCDLEPEDNQNQIILSNLQELQLQMESMTEEHLTCIHCFFDLCPMPFLEKLFIQLPEEDKNAIHQRYMDVVTAEQKSADVVFSHLKVIMISNFHGSVNEMKLVKFFLEKAVTLECLLLVGPPVYNKVEATNYKFQFGSVAENKHKERMTTKIIKGQISMLQKSSADVRIVYSEFFDDERNFSPRHEHIYPDFKYFSGTLCHLAKSGRPERRLSV